MCGVEEDGECLVAVKQIGSIQELGELGISDLSNSGNRDNN